MSQTKTWTDQTELDTTTGAKATLDQLISYSGDFSAGQVWVEYSTDDTTYQEMPGTRRVSPDAFQLSQPDPDIYLRFACQRITGTLNCYMGP